MQTEAKRLWKLNEALSLGILSPLASLYTPVAPPSTAPALKNLHWQPDRVFHTSALCAATLDSITLPYRLQSPSPTSPLGPATGTANCMPQELHHVRTRNLYDCHFVCITMLYGTMHDTVQVWACKMLLVQVQ